MDTSKLKRPTKEGLAKAKENFRELIKPRKPSARLVDIIDKVTHENERIENERKKEDIAARSSDAEQQ